MDRQWQRKAGGETGWGKQASHSHLGHFPLWAGQRALRTDWMHAPPSGLRLSSKACNAHLRVSAWSTTVPPGCTKWTNVYVNNRPDVWKNMGTPHWVGPHQCRSFSQQVSLIQYHILSNPSGTFYRSSLQHCNCGATMTADVSHRSVWVSSCRSAPIHSSWALGWGLPVEQQSKLGGWQFSVASDQEVISL